MGLSSPAYRVVLSASRRTDMARWYPGDIVRALEKRYPPEKTHSVVLVTKFPGSVLAEPLRTALEPYDQVVVQATITGLGGTVLEPRVPLASESLAALPALIDFVGGPERVVVRIDPIVHWREVDAPGTLRTNLDQFGPLARAARDTGVSRIKTSLVSPYPKAVRRFAAAGLELVSLGGDDREEVLRRLEQEAREAGVTLEFCCEPTRPPTACIDATLLTSLHPKGLPARPDRASGQRGHCGCTHSVDLGWYSTHPCSSGCLYCYANPIIPKATGPENTP